MAITTLREMWGVIEAKLPRDHWVPLQEIYGIVESEIKLQPDDFLPAAPTTDDPKWKRNVRNVLQSRKTKGDIAWDRDGKYMIQTTAFAVLEDGVKAVSGTATQRTYILSHEGFKKIQESREEIGLLGEEWVVDYEIRSLRAAGRHDLAAKVQRISVTNVAAGYDVLSFDTNGSEKYIEVKTTALSRKVFQITAHELEVAKGYRQRYWLYFISEIRGEPELVVIRDLAEHIGSTINLTPMTYQAEIKLADD